MFREKWVYGRTGIGVNNESRTNNLLCPLFVCQCLKSRLLETINDFKLEEMGRFQRVSNKFKENQDLGLSQKQTSTKI